MGGIFLGKVPIPTSVIHIRRKETKSTKPTFFYIIYPHFEVTSTPRKTNKSKQKENATAHQRDLKNAGGNPEDIGYQN